MKQTAVNNVEASTSTAAEDHSGTERLKALADGLFGVVMTLLVLDLKLPEGSKIQDSGLLDALFNSNLTLTFFIYIITFLTAGVYWYNHVRIMRRLKHIDEGMVWLNLAFFLFVTILPFTADLFTKIVPAGSNTVLIYSGNNVIIGVLLIIVWLYASHDYRLITKEVQPYEIPIITWWAAVMPTTALISIIVTLVSNSSLGVAAYYVIPAVMSTAVGFAQGRARRKHEGGLDDYNWHWCMARFSLTKPLPLG